jgi:hypothetical protein
LSGAAGGPHHGFCRKSLGMNCVLCVVAFIHLLSLFVGEIMIPVSNSYTSSESCE